MKDLVQYKLYSLHYRTAAVLQDSLYVLQTARVEGRITISSPDPHLTLAFLSVRIIIDNYSTGCLEIKVSWGHTTLNTLLKGRNIEKTDRLIQGFVSV